MVTTTTMKNTTVAKVMKEVIMADIIRYGVNSYKKIINIPFQFKKRFKYLKPLQKKI